MVSEKVIGAFSEEQAAAISGVSLGQLRNWRKESFFRPAYGADESHVPYGRLYSFRDLVSLQILNDLRNDKRIPLAHLRDVSRKLSHLGEDRWIATTLFVLGKRVVFDDPKTSERREIVSGQRVFDIPLRVVARNTRERIQRMNDRSGQEGTFSSRRYFSQNREVFSGTRVPVSAVVSFLRAGYSDEDILREYPVLTEADLRAAKILADKAAA